MPRLSQVAWQRGGRSHSMLRGQGPAETQVTGGRGLTQNRSLVVQDRGGAGGALGTPYSA